MVSSNDMGRNNNGAESKGKGWRPSGRQVLWLLIFAVSALFVVLNNERAEVNLIVASPRWPTWTLVVASLVLGYLLAKLTGWRRRDD